MTAPRANPPAGPDWLAGGFRGTFNYRGRVTRGEFWKWWFFWQGSTLAALFIGSAISTAPDAAAGLAAIVWILLGSLRSLLRPAGCMTSIRAPGTC